MTNMQKMQFRTSPKNVFHHAIKSRHLEGQKARGESSPPPPPPHHSLTLKFSSLNTFCTLVQAGPLLTSYQKKRSTWYVNSNCFSNWNLSKRRKRFVWVRRRQVAQVWIPPEIKMFTVILTVSNSWSHFQIFDWHNFTFLIVRICWAAI